MLRVRAILRSALAEARFLCFRAQGFLTLFAFLLAGAYINPAATAIDFLAGNIKPRRFLALRACPASRGSAPVRWGASAPFAAARSRPRRALRRRACASRRLTRARARAAVATEMVATVAAVAAVAEALKYYPVPGVQAPTPPNTGAAAATVAASEFAIAASTFLGAPACNRQAQKQRNPNNPGGSKAASDARAAPLPRPAAQLAGCQRD